MKPMIQMGVMTIAEDENGVDVDDDSDLSTDDADEDGLGDDETTAEATSTATEDATASSSNAGITPTQMAKNNLRKANKQENAGSVTLVGDTSLVAGVTANLKNFGAFDNKYIVSKAVHKISNGYDVDIEVRKCLNGY